MPLAGTRHAAEGDTLTHAVRTTPDASFQSVQQKIAAANRVCCTSEQAEVNHLPQEVVAQQTNGQGIKTMLIGKAERHEAAWKTYQTSKDKAQKQHDQMVASAAAALNDKLTSLNASIEVEMAVLAQDVIMQLDEQQIMQVWDTATKRGGGSSLLVDELGVAFAAAESALRQAMEGALLIMVSQMCEVGHLDEGQVQRLMEDEVQQTNSQVLDNRRTAADVLRRLHQHQVLQEQSRHSRWQAAVSTWRTLRSKHAIQVFCQHVQTNLAEPPERLQLYAHLQDGQETASDGLAKLCQRICKLRPPVLTKNLTDAWVKDAQDWNSQWLQHLEDHLHKLQQHEEHIEQQAQEGLSALHADLLGYKGHPPEQVEQMLQQDVLPIINGRREAALQLLNQTEAFLKRQAAEWKLALDILSHWLCSLVVLFEGHKNDLANAESAIKGHLKNALDCFAGEDASREAAMEAAVLSVSHGSSEAALDDAVERALQCLATIEAGYREYAASAVEAAQGYPIAINDCNERYSMCLCGMLHLQPTSTSSDKQKVLLDMGRQDQQQQQQQQAPMSFSGVNKPSSLQSLVAPASAPKTSSNGQTIDGSSKSAASTTAQDIVQVPGGRTYQLLHDLWQALQDATPKPWIPVLCADQGQAAHAAEFSNTANAAGAVAAVTGSSPALSTAVALSAANSVSDTPAAPTAPPKTGAAGTGKVTAKQAEVEAAAAASQAALAAAEAAAAAAVAAAAVAAAAPLPCPMALNGTVLCKELAVPSALVQQALEQLQRSLLAEMEESRVRSEGSAEAWSQQVEAVITQELDSRLRAHRPRAGRLEEEVRASRSSELLGQRRRVQQHMQSQSTAVKQQSSTFDESVQQLQADVASWKAKLLNYEKLLSNSLSLKGLDVTWREGLALGGKLDKQVHERIDNLHAWVSNSCAAVTAANRKFEVEQLKPFADGGSYADENIAAYKASMSGIDHHMEAQQQQQQQQLSGLLAELSAELQGAQQLMEESLPSYKQDMTLIEALNRYVEGAKKTVSTQLGRNRQAAEEINATLAQLQHQLDLGALSGPDSSVAIEAAEGSPGALQHCQGMLSQLNCLRLQLLRQAQVLNVLQSSNLTQTSIGINFSPRLPPFTVPSLATGTSAASAVDLQGPAGPARPAVPTKQPHQASGSSAGGSHPMAQAESSAASQTHESPAVALAKEVQSVVDAANQEVETAAKAYYAAKDPNRPVRYPARIPATHIELINQTGSTLADLAQQLQHHMTSAEQQLRVQVVQAYRLLQQAPAAAMALTHQHLLAAAQQQYAALLADFGIRHKTLELQLEQHKRSLKPSMLHPNRRAELQALKQAETTRQADAAALTAACVAACLSLTSSHAHQLTRSLAELCQLLLQLLDGFVMPADVAAAPEGAAAVEWQGLPRKSLMELSKLALAQDEAAPIGPAVRMTSATGAKSSTKTVSGKAAETAGDGASMRSRPFPCMIWQLAPGAFSPMQLGWLPEDQANVGGLSAHLTQKVAASATSLPQRVVAPAAAVVGQAQQKGPAAGTNLLGSGQQQQQHVLHGQLAEQGAEGCQTVTALDTPCQRAVVRAHKAAVAVCEQALAAQVCMLKTTVYKWLRQEQQWGDAWRQMMDELDCV